MDAQRRAYYDNLLTAIVGGLVYGTILYVCALLVLGGV